MKPTINGTEFGSITIDKEVMEHDVIIRFNGEVKKRKKKLSKAVYGTSRFLCMPEEVTTEPCVTIPNLIYC